MEGLEKTHRRNFRKGIPRRRVFHQSKRGIMKSKTNSIYLTDPMEVFIRFDPEQFDLVYLDSPIFGTHMLDLNNPKEPPYQDYREFLNYLLSIYYQSFRVLKQTGVLLLRVNPLSPYNPRLFLDSIFGNQRFQAGIIWETQPFGRNKYGLNVNYESVLFYSKSENFTYNELWKALPKQEILSSYRHKDDKGNYKLWNLMDNITRPDRQFSWNDITLPPDKSWKYSKSQLDGFFSKGEIDFSGKNPRRKLYFSSEKLRKPLGFVWDFAGFQESSKSRIDNRLLKAVEMVTNPGDLVLDPFMNPKTLETYIESRRNWVGVSQFEVSTRSFSQFQSVQFEEISDEKIHKLDIIDNKKLPQKFIKLISDQMQSIDVHSLSKNDGKYYAFLVGINHFKDGIPNLKFCINDVRVLGQTLKDIGYTTKIIHDELEDDTLTPLRSNIFEELRNWIQSITPEDTLLVHFSSHGTLINDKACILTSDSRKRSLEKTVLPVKEVVDVMKSGRARKLILSLDICHGGVEMGRAILGQEFENNVYDLAEGFALLAASTAQQVAVDMDEQGHGLFTYYLINGLRGDADTDNDGRITVEDIRNYILASIRKWNITNGGYQEPTFKYEGIGEITLVNSR